MHPGPTRRHVWSQPKWNEASKMYQLDFQGRATMASCKNIQLHAKNGPDSDVCFLMGKVDDNKFNVDFKSKLLQRKLE